MAQRVNSLKSQLEQLDKKDKPFEFKNINPKFNQNRLHSEIVIEAKNLSKKLNTLNFENTIIEEIKEKNSGLSQEVIRTFLGSLLFRGNEVYKHIKVLSIDERVRVAFTNLLLGDSHLLLLDEPLNHLDIDSRERIEKALENYPGAFLVVTHDRYFVKNTVSEIWELNSQGLDRYKGNYEDFLKHKKGEFKDNEKIKEEALKMKKAELIAKLTNTENKEEIELINKKLDEL